MRIVCHKCGCPIDLPDSTAPGVPIVCPRCGNAGTYRPPGPPRPAKVKRSGASGPTALVLLGSLILLCIGGAMAVAIPWPMFVVATLGAAGGVVVMTGKVGRTWRARWPLGIGLVVVSGLVAVLAVISAISNYETARRAEEAAAAAAAAERHRRDVTVHAP